MIENIVSADQKPWHKKKPEFTLKMHSKHRVCCAYAHEITHLDFLIGHAMQWYCLGLIISIR